VRLGNLGGPVLAAFETSSENFAQFGPGTVTMAFGGHFTSDVYYAYSLDNRHSWSANVRVNDRPIDRRLGVWSNGYDIRTPVGVASTDALAVLGWDDTRNSDIIDAQAVFAGIVQHRAVEAGSGAWRVALAALTGLLVAGAALLAMSRRGAAA
jgi:hypothetical protein